MKLGQWFGDEFPPLVDRTLHGHNERVQALADAGLSNESPEIIAVATEQKKSLDAIGAWFQWVLRDYKPTQEFPNLSTAQSESGCGLCQ